MFDGCLEADFFYFFGDFPGFSGLFLMQADFAVGLWIRGAPRVGGRRRSCRRPVRSAGKQAGSPLLTFASFRENDMKTA